MKSDSADLTDSADTAEVLLFDSNDGRVVIVSFRISQKIL